jgi:hypothetical protein
MAARWQFGVADRDKEGGEGGEGGEDVSGVGKQVAHADRCAT